MHVPSLISCQKLNKSFGTQLLFSDLSLGFFPGERLGLIGPNGSGKSTLLKIMAGIEKPSSGYLSQKRDLRLVYLAQSDVFDPEKTVEEVLFSGVSQNKMHWSADREMRLLVEEMAFEEMTQPVASLSGGWRKRLSIAHALLQKPDLLLMDEPTNHLDLEGILWLEARLQSAGFPFVLVSHDRFFLENTTNAIIELNRQYPEGYLRVEGNYSTFLERRAAFLDAQVRQEVALSSQVRREVAWLQRGPKARTTKAQYRLDQAEVLQKELSAVKARNAQNQQAAIDFDSTDRKTKILIETKDVCLSLGGKRLFSDLNLTLSPGYCLGLLGPNGSGKSTLIHLLSGEIVPDSGSVKKAQGLKTVTFGQHREQLDQNQTLKAALSPEGGDQVIFQGRPIHIVSWAKRFLFTTQQLDLPVSRLSGGEQARLLIANLMLKPADVLLLDEPTNDLDIPTLEVLETRLEEFPGAIVLITHDRFLLNRLSDLLLSFEGDGKTAFYADIHQWQRTQQLKMSEESVLRQAAKSEMKKIEKHTNKLSHKERKEFNRMEEAIEKANEDVDEIKSQMQDPEVQSNAERLVVLGTKLKAAEEKVEKLYRRWEELEMRSG